MHHLKTMCVGDKEYCAFTTASRVYITSNTNGNLMIMTNCCCCEQKYVFYNFTVLLVLYF